MASKETHAEIAARSVPRDQLERYEFLAARYLQQHQEMMHLAYRSSHPGAAPANEHAYRELMFACRELMQQTSEAMQTIARKYPVLLRTEITVALTLPSNVIVVVVDKKKRSARSKPTNEK